MRISDGSSDVCSSDLVVRDGAVDRGELGRRVFGDGEALRRLERIIHPRVYRAERRFIARAVRDREAMVVRDVPLLFETGGDRRCDVTVVVRSEEHTSELQSLMRISYAVFCLKKKKIQKLYKTRSKMYSY